MGSFRKQSHISLQFLALSFILGAPRGDGIEAGMDV